MENKVIEYNLLGSMITQDTMDQIAAEASVAVKSAPVTVVIRNIAGNAQFPRLIVDYGEVVHLLVAELREQKARQAALERQLAEVRK